MNLLFVVVMISVTEVQMTCLSFRAGKMVLKFGDTTISKKRKNVNPFAANVPVIKKPATGFALVKSAKNTCGIVTFLKMQVIDLHYIKFYSFADVFHTFCQCKSITWFLTKVENWPQIG